MTAYELIGTHHTQNKRTTGDQTRREANEDQTQQAYGNTTTNQEMDRARSKRWFELMKI